MHPPALSFVAAWQAALAHSRYLGRLATARPEIEARLRETWQAPFAPDAMHAALLAEPGATADDATLGRALRRLRGELMARLVVRDLAGLADLAEVTATMTAFADFAVGRALERVCADLSASHGRPLGGDGRVQELHVVGMGKLGGGELNVSSDIDLIFTYPEDGETAGRADGGGRISNFEFFTRAGRRLIAMLAEVTGDGQVFRVDMRLRPNGDSGPLVASFDMLETYFVAQGREWERYAWIKARCMTGARGGELEAIDRPFIFRKYLDYGAINAMRDLHAQIRREVARRELADHVKLGPGGIREIEFIAQVFQLIRGGRDAALRIRPTLSVLPLLAARQLISPEAARELADAYVFLRRLEHRLQYLDDQQTHSLPAGDAERALVARSMDFAGYPAMLAELDRHRAIVSRHFDAVFSEPEGRKEAHTALWRNAGDAEATSARLAELGFRAAADTAERLRQLGESPMYQSLPQSNRDRLDAIVPQLIEAAAGAADPDLTLARGLDFFASIARRGAYLALLQQYPQALRKVAELVGSSAWAAEYLTHHPILLDELLDPRLLDAATDSTAFRVELAGQLANLIADHPDDTERQMDILREAHHAQVFRLLAQDLAGLLTVERLADHLSLLADIMLDTVLRLCWQQLRRRHRETPRFAVIGYGKLGGKELGYASDLDIIFLYDDPDPDAPEIYARFAQRINTWLSSRTPSGILFETDLRLRPNGESGLLVSSLDAFRQYQAQEAWVWEHQALTRARFCAGDAEIGARFEEIRDAVLRLPREAAKLREEVLSMRQKMRDAHGNDSGLFDLKHDRGGIIDVEFIVQYLVLAHSHAHPRLTANFGNIALLRIAGELGLIPADPARATADAYREYRRQQHALRLNGARYARLDPALLAAEREAVLELWRQVFGEA